MNIELLEEYVALAKHLNFSETSARLNLSQPTLSRHISQLESDLQVQLFERDKQSVQLTNIGKAFLPEAKKVLASWEHARQCISGFHAGITGQLAIGYKHVYGVETWMNTLSAFQTRYPQIALDIQSFSGFDEIHDSLLSGKIDIAMTLSLDEFVSPAFRMLTLESAPLYASMSVTNPLIEKHTLLCGDLAAETLIFPHTNNHLSIAKILRGFFRSRGLNPKVAYSAKNMDEAIMRVRLNNYINIVPKCYFPHDTDNFYGIRSIEIEDTANLFRLLILARKDNQNPAINLFFSLCQESISSSEK